MLSMKWIECVWVELPMSGEQFLDGSILFGSGLEIGHHSSSPPFPKTASRTLAASS
jgi:hypothetical protein